MEIPLLHPKHPLNVPHLPATLTINHLWWLFEKERGKFNDYFHNNVSNNWIVETLKKQPTLIIYFGSSMNIVCRAWLRSKSIYWMGIGLRHRRMQVCVYTWLTVLTHELFIKYIVIGYQHIQWTISNRKSEIEFFWCCRIWIEISDVNCWSFDEDLNFQLCE